MTYPNPQGTTFESEPTTQIGGVSPFAGPQGASSAFIEGGVGVAHATQLSDYKIIRRNGAVVAFEPSKIAIASSEFIEQHNDDMKFIIDSMIRPRLQFTDNKRDFVQLKFIVIT